MSLKFSAIALLLSVLITGKVYAQHIHFVAVDGLATNSGSMQSPWSLAYALNGAQAAGNIAAGDSIYLLGGIYTGRFTSFLNFAGTLPVYVKNYDTSRVTLDGNTGENSAGSTLTVNGNNAWFMGLEVTGTTDNRIFNNLNAPVITGINIYGKNIRIINCIVHNNSLIGIGAWKEGENNELYGNLIFHNGSCIISDQGQPFNHGPGIYAQNRNAAAPQKIINNFIFKNFTVGIEAKTVNEIPGRSLNGLIIDSNTLFNSGALCYDTMARKYNLFLGSEVYPANPAENIFCRSNVFYRDETDGAASFFIKGELKPPYYNQQNITLGLGQIDSFVSFRNNYVIGSSYTGSIYVQNNFRSFDLQNNTVYDPLGATRSALLGIEYFGEHQPNDTIKLAGTWNNNRYFTSNLFPFARQKNQNQLQMLDLAGFRKTYKTDAQSMQSDAIPPDTAFIRQNKYAPSRFYVTVLSNSKQSTFLLPLGHAEYSDFYYQVKDVQNYYGKPVATGTYDGNSLLLPLLLEDAGPVTGNVPLQPRHTSQAMGSFVIIFYKNSPLNPTCDAPTGLHISNLESSVLTLQWVAANNASRYIIEKFNGSSWDSIGTTSNTSYPVLGLYNYDNHKFRVGTRCSSNSQPAYSNQTTTPGKYFVSVAGTANSKGSISSPWRLSYALADSAGLLKPGDTIFIRGGSYQGNFKLIYLKGSLEHPIVISNFPQERVIVDGNTGVNNAYALQVHAYNWFVQLVGIEVTNSFNKRLFSTNPVNIGTGIYVEGNSIKLINCSVHDIPGDGILIAKDAIGTEVYGCMVYNNGYENQGALTGAGIVVLNGSKTNPKLISNNFVFRNFNYGILSYGRTNTLAATGVSIEYNTIFNTGALASPLLTRKYNLYVTGIANEFPASAINIKNNIFYRDDRDAAGGDKPYNLRYNISFGQSNVLNRDLLFQQNKLFGGGFYGALYVQGPFEFNLANNSFYTPDNRNKLLFVTAGATPGPTWNWNKYYNANQTSFNGQNFADWKSNYGADANSSFSFGGLPTDTVYLWRNNYNRQLFYISVLNYSLADSISLPLLHNRFKGQPYAVFDIQNLYGSPVKTGVYTGNAIKLFMGNTLVDSPQTGLPSQPLHCNKSLGVFVLQFTGSSETCSAANLTLQASQLGSQYQWQVNTGSSFENISDGQHYDGTNDYNLVISQIPSGWRNYQYRCLVNEQAGAVHTIQFFTTWTGAASTAWENPLNWSCGQVPDENTSVIIPAGQVTVNSNASCYSLLNRNAQISIQAGASLHVSN